MLRQIVKPKERRIVLELPEEYVNQEVEVIAFRTAEPAAARPKAGNLLNYAGVLADSPNFKEDLLAWQRAQRDEWR
jgi:hypothetical protein